MPNVTALPRTLENGRTLTQFTDTTSTSAVTYTYPTQQTGIQIENSGEKDITVTVGSYTQTVKADTKWKVDVSFTSVSISSVVNSQEFIATAFVDVVTDVNTLATSVADIVKLNNGANDTEKFKNALLVAQNKRIVLEPNAVYEITDKLVMPKGCEIVGNGATINFRMSGNVECFLPDDNCIIDNLIINQYVVVASSGLGQFQCPITIGEYYTTVSRHNVTLSNLTIYSERNNGNGILVTSGSTNIIIENITFPDNNLVGRPILVHWGNYLNKTTLTTHPHNIKIRNIKIGKLGLSTSDTTGIFLSGVYNVDVKNVTIEEVNTAGMIVYPGDMGFENADVNEKKCAYKNINIENVIVKKSNGIGFNVRFTSSTGEIPSNIIYSTGIVFRNCVTVGNGLDTITGAGFFFEKVADVLIENCTSSGHVHGLVTSSNVIGLTVRDGEYFDNLYTGIYFGNLTFPAKHCKAIDVKAYGNGKLSSAAYKAGITLANTYKCIVDNCRLGSTVETTQISGVKFIYDNGSPSKAVVKNCHVEGVTSGGVAYDINAYTFNFAYEVFENNTSVDGITYTNAGGTNSTSITGKGNVITYGSSTPGSLTWKQGDIVKNTNPTNGTFEGWVCTVAGTPGTWKPYGYIANVKTGTVTYNGDGAATSKVIPHGLGVIPTYYHVELASVDAGTAVKKYVTVDATNITVYFNTAPITGTNNVVLNWKAEG